MLGFIFKIIRFCIYAILLLLFIATLMFMVSANKDERVVGAVFLAFIFGVFSLVYKAGSSKSNEKVVKAEPVTILNMKSERSETSVAVRRAINKARSWAEEVKRKSETRRKLVETKSAYLASLKARVAHEPLEVVVLGGKGWETKKGVAHLVFVTEDVVFITDPESKEEVVIPMAEFTAIEISGPGKVSGDAGVAGGGFGLEGALQGIALATALNILTSHSTTKTVIRLETHKSELIMLSSKIEPEPARILFSSIFLRTRNASRMSVAESIPDQILKLHGLMEDGVITDEEFSRAKSKLIG